MHSVNIFSETPEMQTYNRQVLIILKVILRKNITESDLVVEF